MTEKEHRDVYIAAAVGGVGLVLVLLYLFGGATTASDALNADGTPLPSTTASAPPGLSDYNYNISPYNPAPLIPNGRGAVDNASVGGCCDDCGPSTGQQYNLPNVAQFMTLLGTGSG